MMADRWCDLCQRWTSPRPEVEPMQCSNCWELYGCPDCGFEIDLQARCLRGEAGAGVCPGPGV